MGRIALIKEKLIRTFITPIDVPLGIIIIMFVSGVIVFIWDAL